MATTEVHTARGEFHNEPLTDFSKSESRTAMEKALHDVLGTLGREYPILIGGENIFTDEKIKSINPARPGQVVGIFQNGTVEIANRAVDTAHGAFERWKRVPAEERIACLFRVADILRRRRFELNALLVYEIGKSWIEADADIAELIDFTKFYAHEMRRLAGPRKLVPVRGEKNFLVYIPLGVGIVIPPWNFAAAIMGGMTLAAVVTGNTVVLKPSSDSPTIAAEFVNICYEAGIPNDVVNFFTGPGRTAGEAMVTNAKTRFIAFTGSMEAGLRIGELAAKKQPGQIWIKRTVLEMGGKDAIIVDDDTDIDAAAEGVAQAAFGYQGQKCSACSRAIVSEKIYDKILEKLIPRVEAYIEVGKKEGRLVAGGNALPGEGYFLRPTVIADVAPTARVAQEEIFGPVLAVIKARNFDHALEIANGTEFGLTGAVYSNDPAKLEKASEEFHVGNLYLNRKCTGALVGAHPFGGFNMSGTDSKAGGQDYLLLFLQAKSVAEKIPAA